jgi:hypothetical protein
MRRRLRNLSSGKRNTNALPQVAWAEPSTHESGRIVGNPETILKVTN